MTNPILVDLLLVAVILLFTFLGAKRGFVLTLCSLVAVLIGLWGANFLADAFAPTVANAVKGPLERSITAALEERFEQSINGNDTGAFETDMMEMLDVLRTKGGVFTWAADALDTAGDQWKDTLNGGLTNAIAQASAKAAAAVAGQLAHGAIFIIGFILILIGWAILSHALNLVAKLPVLSTLNRGLGGILGLIKGVIIAYVAVWGLSVSGTVTPDVSARTTLFLFLAQHSPLELLISGTSLLS